MTSPPPTTYTPLLQWKCPVHCLLRSFCFGSSFPLLQLYIISSSLANLISLLDSFGGSVVKNPPADVGDVGLIAGLERAPRVGNGNPLLYSCLENSMDGGAWWATVHGVAKSRTRLSDFTHSLILINSKCLATLAAWFKYQVCLNSCMILGNVIVQCLSFHICKMG